MEDGSPVADGPLPDSPLVLVTGATDGIGRETALELARRGARVVAHGRRSDRVDAVHRELERASGTKQPLPVTADLGELRHVRAFAAELSAREEGIQVLVNNAGVYMKKRQITADGIEMTMAVNHFAPFLLTLQMLEGPHAGTLRRIVNVSSMAHLSGRLYLTDPGFVRRRFDVYQAYAASKLANVLFTVELAHRLGASAPTVNALHLGTGLDQAAPRRLSRMKGSDSLQEGATTSAFLAVDPSVATLYRAIFRSPPGDALAHAPGDADWCRRFYDASAALVASPRA